MPLRSPSPRADQRPHQRGPRVNENIRIRQVRLIDENGEQIGITPTPIALDMARERGLDLVEIAPNSQPPVAKILDFGKFRYEQNRRRAENKRRQKAGTVKEVRFGPRTGDHDIQFKIKRLEKFLREGNKVKAWVRMRGRELAHPEVALRVLERVKTSLEPHGVIERDVTCEQDGRVLSIIMAPQGKN
ncbi:MAG: translation initiation factor IF-3 [Chloroflexota bacterium]|nr:translation initiation factor IF-3 [Chloroflexota bacterium]